jgi:Domain of unknown function (DUF4389)
LTGQSVALDEGAPACRRSIGEHSSRSLQGGPAVEPVEYPVKFSVDYPDRDLNRLTTFFRVFTVIPIAIVISLLERVSYTSGSYTYSVSAGALVVFPTVLMILFRKKYPRWWFDWNLELSRFAYRVAVYLSLMDDTYPSTDEQQAVRLDYRYPDVESEIGRGMPLVKWLLAIPHYFLLFFLGIGAFFAVIAAWFAILFTGRYPRGIFDFVEGVHRWAARVAGYSITMVTDRYPPFSLKP